MKKLFMLCFCLSILSPVVYAQEFDLVGQMGEDTEEKKDTGKTESVSYETQKDEENVADDHGIFSFLNFSFIKKKFSFSDDEEDNEDSTSSGETEAIKETPLQRKIRKAEEGNVDAQLTLGYMYLYGENGVQSDYPQAFRFYEMAAAQNNPIALNNLGSLYFSGIGTKRDYVKAAQLFAKAAQAGSDDAAVNLGFIYLSSNGNKEILQEAVSLFKQAAERGNNTAKFMMGYAYYKGFYVEQDYHKAVALIKEAAAAQFDEAEYILAIMYMKGEGIAQNYGNTVKFLNRAVVQGNIQATMILADVLSQGAIYPKNPVKAHILYNIASVYNAPEAAQKRDNIKKELKIDDLLKAQTQAEKFKAKPSELTAYIRQTFGNNVRRYIDDNLSEMN